MSNYKEEYVNLCSADDISDYYEDGKFDIPVKYKFEEKNGIFRENMIAILMLSEKIFLNTLWYRSDLSEEDRKYFRILAICNDVFMWACADCEDVEISEIEDLFDHWQKDPRWGVAIWCIKKRGIKPQPPVYKDIQNAGIWDLDAMNLK